MLPVARVTRTVFGVNYVVEVHVGEISGEMFVEWAAQDMLGPPAPIRRGTFDPLAHRAYVAIGGPLPPGQAVPLLTICEEAADQARGAATGARDKLNRLSRG